MFATLGVTIFLTFSLFFLFPFLIVEQEKEKGGQLGKEGVKRDKGCIRGQKRKRKREEKREEGEEVLRAGLWEYLLIEIKTLKIRLPVNIC